MNQNARTGGCGYYRAGNTATLRLLTLFVGTSISTAAGAAQLSEFGQNQLQTATGAAVQTACGKMIPIQEQLDPTQRELFFRCGELVQTGNDLTPGDPGGTGNSLQIDADELAEALQNVAPEEAEAVAAGMTDTQQDQLAGIADRLQYLRTGTSTLPVAGLHWSGEDLMGGAAGADGFSRLGGFVTGVYGTGDRDEVDRRNGVENAYDFDAWGLTLGIDYRFTDSLILGAAFGYIDSEVEFDRNYGENNTEGMNFAAYGSWFSGNLFIEGTLGYGDYEYDMRRDVFYLNNNPGNPSMGEDIDQSLTSKTDGENWNWSLGVGYNWYTDSSNWTLIGKLIGIDAEVDGYSERGGELAMQLDDQDFESLQSIISGQFAHNISMDFGVMVPFVNVAWHHEFEDDTRSINARYVFDINNSDPENTLTFQTTGLDEDFFRLGLGVNFVLTGGNQWFINYDTLLGLREVTSHALTVGLRMEF